ncbi:amino acid ABC transporter permease [Brucella pseudogrignonensis]|jgi:polar amino acid transport system permease protein|uniref:Amino acid ABC transporter permease n=1 Tax=Brucella pseudogrignonensis TaxID=419475 RepID=A0A7Y3WZ90_9HYPH|nr:MULTISPECIES: amino acid ABC transporter permease [Brucella]MCM0753454.1 amino acid ABC transporter permease [Brucella pseudogrignonensis]NNV23008.1 amino acid ABC transporter permease [Brucella pseudogrignonensis]
MFGNLNIRVISEYLPELWQGFLNTLMLSAAGFTGALIIGIVACALSIQPVRWLRRIGIAYIDLIRATPLLAQLYFLYFGLPRFGVLLPEIVIGIIALSLNSGAYVAEIIRSGILSIPRGQFEAALSSGFTYLQRMRLVVLPQAVRPTISPMIGQAIVLVKDSSLLSLISVVELTRVGQQIALDRFMPVEGFAATAAGFLLIYYLLKALAGTWSRFNRMPER